jgi:hypothetical protein
VLAVTGGLDQGVVTLQVISLEDWCGSPVDPCMIGRWVSTKVEITDETTGAPVTELGGGDGVVMTIARDGKVVIDHNGMSPIRSDVSGIIFQTTVRGVSNATIKSRNGQVEVVTNDFATTATAQVQTGGLASRPLAGTPVLGTGTYQCSSTTLDLSSPYPLGTAKSSFQKQS